MSFTMTGTTGSTFTGVQSFKAGRVGYRSLGSNEFRIRLEPTNGAKFNLPTATTAPGGSQNRYSVVVNGTDALVQTLAAWTRELAAASIVEVLAQPEVYIPAVPASLSIQ